MAPPPGSVRVTGYIGPSDTADTYPTHSEEWGKGGMRSVADTAARLAIPADRRKEGMFVKQLDTGQIWTLSGGILDANWVLDPMGVADYLRKIVNIGEVYFVDCDAGVDAANRGTFALPLATIQYAIDNYVVADRNDVVICWGSAGGGFDENLAATGLDVHKSGTILIGVDAVELDNTNVGATRVMTIQTSRGVKVYGFYITPSTAITGIFVDSTAQFVDIGSEDMPNFFSNCDIDVENQAYAVICRGNWHYNGRIAYEFSLGDLSRVINTHMQNAGVGGSVGINIGAGHLDNTFYGNTITGFLKGIVAGAGAVRNTAYDNAINCPTPIEDANAAGLNNWRDNHIVPVKTVSDFTYLAGVAEQDAYEFITTDDLDRRFAGSFDLDANITAAKIMTVRVKEQIDGANYRTIDSKTYTVGTDPNPHFDFVSFRTCKVTLQIDITEGVDRAIPRSVSVRTVE
jgi:hypothetical protein